jgi:pimeloyl-ACP methyl ester carboxylesterase
MSNLPAPHTHSISRGSVRLHARSWPQAQGPWLVFVHGYPDNSHVWDGVLAELANEYKLLAYDVRGAGASSHPQAVADYALPELQADFEAVVDAVIGDERFHLIGHDWGSVQSWEFVTAPRLQSRILSFTTLSGPCLDHIGHWVRNRWNSGNRAERRAVFNQLLHSWYVGAFQIPSIAPGIWKMGLDRLWPGVLARLEQMPTPPPADPQQKADGMHGIKLYRANVPGCLRAPRQRHTQVPVQLLIASDDPFVSPALVSDTHLWTRSLQTHELQGGHWQMLHRPQPLANRIRRFVNSLSADIGRGAASP